MKEQQLLLVVSVFMNSEIDLWENFLGNQIPNGSNPPGFVELLNFFLLVKILSWSCDRFYDVEVYIGPL